MRLPRGNGPDGFDAGVIPDESTLQVRVSEKREAALQIAKSVAGLVGCHHVFVFVPRRTVEDLHAIDKSGAFLQIAHVGGVLGGQLLASPDRSSARDRVEPLQVLLARASLVMIPADDEVA